MRQGSGMASVPPPLIAVVGALGGVGASALASAVAHWWQRETRAGVLIDLGFGRAGVEVLLGIEARPGVRWPDLGAARGEVDGRGLLAALPTWGRVPVLSCTRRSAVAPDDEVVVDVTTALLRVGQPVVLDLPHPAAWTAATRSLAAVADTTYLVTSNSTLGAAAVLACQGSLGEEKPKLVARLTRGGCGIPAVEIAEATSLSLAGVLRDDRLLVGAIERGEGPRVGTRTPLGRLATKLVRAR